MNIQVIYQNGDSGIVDPSILNDLIASNTVKMFLRSEGWANVATDPIRGMGGCYKGVERRKRAPTDFANQTNTEA